MTYVLAHSINGIYDVTRRYVKDWTAIEKRRKISDIDSLRKMLDERNNLLRMNMLDKVEFLIKRDGMEQMDLSKSKVY